MKSWAKKQLLRLVNWAVHRWLYPGCSPDWPPWKDPTHGQVTREIQWEVYDHWEPRDRNEAFILMLNIQRKRHSS